MDVLRQILVQQFNHFIQLVNLRTLCLELFRKVILLLHQFVLLCILLFALLFEGYKAGLVGLLGHDLVVA